MRKTKIVCTLGPKSQNEREIEKMLKNGMNIVRLNFSHGTHELHEKNIKLFRKVRDRLGLPAAVLLDTKGPEIRIGDFQNGSVTLSRGDIFRFSTEAVEGTERTVYVNYEDLPREVKPGNRILLDDGKISMIVASTTDTCVECTVENGGELSGHKSINIPYVHLSMPYISKADEEDLLFGIQHDVDYVAASFVRSKEDVILLRKFLNYHGGHKIRIIAKIENNEGVENFDEILKHADGIMVARGDMGVEVPFERLPGIQKKFIRKCYRAGKPVITATQMLESMIHAVTPTRAEITDVANAVFDGTSAVMLSGETAVGEHPALVVKVMAAIAEQAEADAEALNIYGEVRYENNEASLANAICDAAATTARDVNARVIIAVTKSGETARLVSKFRPPQAIIAATPEEKTFHQLALSWGVLPVRALLQADSEALFRHAIDCAKNVDLVEPGDKAVITAGVPLNTAGTTNVLRVQIVS